MSHSPVFSLFVVSTFLSSVAAAQQPVPPAAPVQNPAAPNPTAPATPDASAPASEPTPGAATTAAAATTETAAAPAGAPGAEQAGGATSAPAPGTAAASAEPSAEAAPVEPAPPAEDVPVPTAVGYEKGFYIEQGENSMAVQGRLQARYTHVETPSGHDEDNFSIARARLTLHGNVFEEGLSYKLQVDFGKGFVTLKDFYLDYCVADDALCVRPGQFKRPFSRQQINSSGNLEFVDRSITDKAFGAGRDIGLMLHDNYEKSPTFEYAIGIFNGTGERSNFSGAGSADLESGDVDVDSGSFSNVPTLWKPALDLRLGYNYGGIKGYSEADFEGGGFRFALGGTVETFLDPDDTDDSLVKGEVDFVVKLEGLAVSGAVYHTSQQDGEGFGDRANGDGGAHFQAGYLIAGKFQPVVRYGIFDPRHEASNNIAEEFAVGLNYYMKQHQLKWQNDLTALNDNGSDTTEWEFRSQAQLSF